MLLRTELTAFRASGKSGPIETHRHASQREPSLLRVRLRRHCSQLGIPGMAASEASSGQECEYATAFHAGVDTFTSQRTMAAREYAASPLEDGKDEHKKSQTRDGTKKKQNEKETFSITEMAAMPLQPRLEPMKHLTGSLTGKVTDSKRSGDRECVRHDHEPDDSTRRFRI